MFSPSRMQSFKLEFHWAFERDQGGGREEVFDRTHISVQASSLTIQVHPSFRTLGATIRPTHLNRGRFFNLCPVHTHLFPLVAQLKRICLMVTDRPPPLCPSPAPLFSGICAGTAGKTEACLLSSATCALICKSSISNRTEATRGPRQSPVLPSPSHTAPPVCCQMLVPRPELQQDPNWDLKLVCIGTWQFLVGRWIKVDGCEKNESFI